MILLDPIGTVETPFQSLSEAPSQGFLDEFRGTISLRPRLSYAIDGLSEDELIDVVWYANGADRSLLRLNDRKGVFASRSQDRPNPISITRCRILSIEDNEIEIEGVDMIDGTPIVDIKPTFTGPGQERTPSSPEAPHGHNAPD
ncbi:MAG: SAM-dependent methyltransferase [Halodesulfurarchaeum sp.]